MTENRGATTARRIGDEGRRIQKPAIEINQTDGAAALGRRSNLNNPPERQITSSRFVQARHAWFSQRSQSRS